MELLCKLIEGPTWTIFVIVKVLPPVIGESASPGS